MKPQIQARCTSSAYRPTKVYLYDGVPLRVVLYQGIPMFVVRDICTAVGFVKTENVLRCVVHHVIPLYCEAPGCPNVKYRDCAVMPMESLSYRLRRSHYIRATHLLAWLEDEVFPLLNRDYPPKQPKLAPKPSESETMTLLLSRLTERAQKAVDQDVKRIQASLLELLGVLGYRVDSRLIREAVTDRNILLKQKLASIINGI